MHMLHGDGVYCVVTNLIYFADPQLQISKAGTI